MGEKDKVTEEAETVANGTNPLENSDEGVAEKEGGENGGVKEMEEDTKDKEKVETDKMDVDPNVKIDSESKEIAEEDKENIENEEQDKEGEENPEDSMESKENAETVKEIKDEVEGNKQSKEKGKEDKEINEEAEDDKESKDKAEDEENKGESQTKATEDKEGKDEVEKDKPQTGLMEDKESEKEVAEAMEDKESGKEEPQTEAMEDKENEKEEPRIKVVADKESNEEAEKKEPQTEAMEEESGSKEKEETEEGEQSEDKVADKVELSTEENDKEEDSKEEKGSKKRQGRNSDGEKVRDRTKEVEKKKEQEPSTPAASGIERPVRERKSVERLVASIERETVKEFHIEKGHGTQLKDIPNVAFKISRKKNDDTLRLLHTILFGRRGKASQFKSNISRFSGFVWHKNEEKQKIKVKEKLDKCVKEKLVELCDLLDISIAKTSKRKDDIVVRLIDFLMAPHATTDVLLAEKEQSSKGKKRKRTVKGSSMSGGTPSKPSKNPRKVEDISKVEKDSTPMSEDDSSSSSEEDEEEEKENGVEFRSLDEMSEHSESEEEKEKESEDESEEYTTKDKQSKKRSRTKKRSGGRSKSKKITIPKESTPPPQKTSKISSSSSNRSKIHDSNDTGPKVFSRKKKDEMVVKEKTQVPSKSSSNPRTGKKAGKSKEKPGEKKSRLSDKQLRDAICEILKEVDFNTATFTDILKQLALEFGDDLIDRKSSIKVMIQEELTKLADEAEDDSDGSQ